LAERLDAADLARRIVDLLSDKQADNILLLDIRKVATFADYFVIASGTSERQINALLEAIREELKTMDLKMRHQEGSAESGWVLLDLGDVVLHIFAPEEREYYDLESLWQAATPVVRIQ